MAELGLYDDRNRFMSPDLGRSIQPDPIGFKGDASNLYRYCGNDWANRSDPMGLRDVTSLQNADLPSKLIENAIARGDLSERGSLLDGVMPNGGTLQVFKQPDAFSTEVPKAVGEAVRQGNTYAQNSSGDPRKAPALDRDALHEGRKAVDMSGDYAAHHGEPTGYNVWRMPDGSIFPQKASRTVDAGNNQFHEFYPEKPAGAKFVANGHWHLPNKNNPHQGSSFSDRDKIAGRVGPIMHNNNSSQWPYEIYFRGWQWFMNSNENLSDPKPY